MIRKSLWLLAAHVVAVAAAVWFNTAILCAADARYDNGCGGFKLYFSLWVIFTIPLLLTAIGLEWWRRSPHRWALRVGLYAVINVAVIEIGWLVLGKFPLLLLLEAVVIAAAVLAQRYAVQTAAVTSHSSRSPDLH